MYPRIERLSSVRGRKFQLFYAAAKFPSFAAGSWIHRLRCSGKAAGRRNGETRRIGVATVETLCAMRHTARSLLAVERERNATRKGARTFRKLKLLHACEKETKSSHSLSCRQVCEVFPLPEWCSWERWRRGSDIQTSVGWSRNDTRLAPLKHEVSVYYVFWNN